MPEQLRAHLKHEELRVEVDERVEQDLGTVRAELFCLPQVLLLNSEKDIKC